LHLIIFERPVNFKFSTVRYGQSNPAT